MEKCVEERLVRRRTEEMGDGALQHFVSSPDAQIGLKADFVALFLVEKWQKEADLQCGEWQQIFALTVTYACTLHSSTSTTQHPTPHTAPSTQCNKTLTKIVVAYSPLFCFTSASSSTNLPICAMSCWCFGGTLYKPADSYMHNTYKRNNWGGGRKIRKVSFF